MDQTGRYPPSLSDSRRPSDTLERRPLRQVTRDLPIAFVAPAAHVVWAGSSFCAGACGGSNCRAGSRRSGNYRGVRLALLLLALPYVRARPCGDGIASKKITDYFPDHVSHG